MMNYMDEDDATIEELRAAMGSTTAVEVRRGPTVLRIGELPYPARIDASPGGGASMKPSRIVSVPASEITTAAR